MPRPSSLSPRLHAIPGAIYSPFADRLCDHPGPIYPLHVGDTWMEPFEGGRMQDLRVEDHPGMHRYCDTRGLPELVDAIVDKVRARNQLACERESVLVAAGATGALACAAGALLSPGEEVLVLAPFWPLIRGIVQVFGGTPVEVPFYDRIDSLESALDAVREKLSDATVALYVSTPSNPTGRVIPEAWLAAFADFARRENLWLLSDEVYEDFIYAESGAAPHFTMARCAPERTLTVWSFSKAYGMAGNRVGYLVGPEPAIAEARKVATHTFYGAPTAGQLAAVRALRDGRAWVERARTLYCDAGTQAARALALPPPQGSTFFFLNVEPRLDDRGLTGFLEDCFDDGVLVAPGSSSGRDYANWVRLCFTAMAPERVGEAARLLGRRLG